MASHPSSPVRAFISVGANIAPATNIPRALDLLARQVHIEAVSSLYRTEPVGPPGQPPFVNGVWSVRTDLPPRDLKFGVLREIERRLGRVRTEDRYAPRPIDLDLILYGRTVVDELDLKLPDPDVARSFVRAALAELDPTLRLPGETEPVSSKAASADPVAMTTLPELTAALRESLIR